MTVIIIEDEPLAVQQLESVLRKIVPDITIAARLDSVRESVAWLKKNEVDLIFSDIHLGDGQSFEIFRQVKSSVPVIFITAYDEYAIQAFKSQGIDYILKPFDEEEIERALEKVRRWLGQPSASAWQERFLVQLGPKIKSVAISEIAYFMADGKYLLLFTLDGARYILDRTITNIEKRLDPRLFFRVNRKFILSYAAIKEMIRYSNSRIKIILSPLPPDHLEVIVSSDRVREFKEWLDK